MEDAVITGIASQKDQTKFTLHGVGDTPGIASGILSPVSDAGIEVDVIVQENFLTIKSSDLPGTEKPKDNVVHKGIARRAFKRTFTLAEDVVVNDAVLKDGLLKVELERVVPEEKKPRVIKIK